MDPDIQKNDLLKIEGERDCKTILRDGIFILLFRNLIIY